MKTVLTNSGVLSTEDGKHIIQGPMYDVSGAQPVNVTNQLLMKKLNALEKEMIVYKAPQENTSSPSSPTSPAATATSCMKR
jgi:thiol:disulfide interchange protein DsbC